MAVSLPGSTASIVSEYAANSINFQRQMVPDANGHLVANFVASLSYQRTDYVVDASGNKLNVIQRNPQPLAMGQQDPYVGFINLQGAALAPLAATTPSTDLLDAIANAADALIHADLVARGIVTA